MSQLSSYLIYFISFMGALALCIVFVPQIIKVSGKKMLFDLPDNERKFHTNIVPRLGGTGIFFAYMIPFCMLMNPVNFAQWNNLIAAFLMLFITGLIDDLRSLNATKKFAAQFLPAIITVYLADVRLTSLYGLFGIEELSYWASVFLSVTGCIFITNAFNFIDGVDGLAATIGLACSTTLGFFLASASNITGATLSFSLAGALAGFLWFNRPPAKIFMGDTGSLPIGYTLSVLCIVLVNSTGEAGRSLIHSQETAFSVAIGILSPIIIDSTRVIFARLKKGASPFRGDRNHIHHYLLDAGYSQQQTVIILGISQMGFIGIAFLLQDINPNFTVFILVAISILAFLYIRHKRKGNGNTR